MSETNSSSSSAGIFDQCSATLGSGATDMSLLECISSKLEQQQVNATSSMHEDLVSLFPRSVLLVFAGSLVVFMQAGFAMVCAGAVRKKNVQNTMLKNLLDACGSSVAFFVLGYGIAFGGMNMHDSATRTETTFMGTTNFFMMDVEDYAFWFFQYAFSAASTTIVAGTLAERCQMTAYLCYSVVLSGWVYPIVAHAIWSQQGFLSASNVDPLFGVGMVDFAGSGVVHITGGVTALFATIILGPRRGRFHDDAGRSLDTPMEFRGHSIALQMLGTFILWFGWYGFNGGSALIGIGHQEANKLTALAAVNTTLGASMGGLTALLAHLWYLERTTGEAVFDLKFAMNGALAGLVSITGGCGVLEPWAALLVGMVGGILYNLGSYSLIRFQLDDAVDAIPVHLVCGVWGVIAVGLFASPSKLFLALNQSEHAGLFYSWRNGNSDAHLLASQIVGIFFIFGWVICIMLPFFIWLDWKGWFRSDPLEEIVGLDLSYHGGFPLLAGNMDEGISPEHMSAFQKKREQSRRDGTGRTTGNGTRSRYLDDNNDRNKNADMDNDNDEESDEDEDIRN